MAKVIIVGGGPAGLACADELSSKGVGCVVLERRPRLGGRADELSCKGQRHCRQCNVCRVYRLRDQVMRSDAVTVHTGVELEQVERNNGRYRLDVHRPREAIDIGSCTRCGKCVEACPTGAMAKRSGKIVLDRRLCRSIQGLECERCVAVCPIGAIDLFGEDHLSATGDAVIIATGSLEFSAENDTRLGWGHVPGVITSMELESLLEGRSTLNIDEGSSLAFLMCVGSRDRGTGTSMCSSVCCKYALRQALDLKERHPSLHITLFIMDWRGMVENDPLLNELRGTDIKVIRSRPAEVNDQGGKPSVRYAVDGRIENETFDHVILVLGLVPDIDDDLAIQLALPRDACGNLIVQNCGDRGIFLAGSCLEPKDIERCVVDGIMAARMALEYLEEGDD